MKKVTFPGKYENLEKITSFFRNAAKQAGLSSFSVYAVETAVDEACTNIIEHGYGGEDIGVIECSYSIDKIGLTITLKDHGRPFDPGEIPDPILDVPLEDREAHGLGLFFIRQWMDEFHFESNPEKGNKMVLVKYRESES